MSEKDYKQATLLSPSLTKCLRPSKRYTIASMSSIVVLFMSHTNGAMRLLDACYNDPTYVGWYSIVLEN